MQTQKVQLNYLRIAPRKTRLVASSLRGLSAANAEAQLKVSPHRASAPLLKLLRSAVVAAKQKKMRQDHLFVSEIRVNQGPASRRYMPRAMGRATLILKRTSHITLVLTEAEKAFPARFKAFSVAEKTKQKRKIQPEDGRTIKKEEEKKPHDVPVKDVATKQDAPRREGIIKRIFRRKAM